MLKSKNILLGITGSIAAYKAAILVRGLIKEGASVKVVMTPLAKQFITPLTIATLSKNPILVDFFDPENGAWNSHVSLGEWADAYLIAPATANTMAKMAYGIADNLLLTTYLSARCPVYVAPAMDLDMFRHDTTQLNMQTLQNRGVNIIEPNSGELASGLSGKGRMAEPEEIIDFLKSSLLKKKDLSGKKFLITAGGTREAIDPVRYISNHSTGKMGYALAEELYSRGADVTLVSGPSALECSSAIKRIDVVSADDMYKQCLSIFPEMDGAIMCAAVADYTPENPSSQKLKKGEDSTSLKLKPTQDIAAELGSRKGKKLLVGFALETDAGTEHAKSKLQRKNFDFIVLNSLSDIGAGFGTDTNKVTIIDKSLDEAVLPLMDKKEVAKAICDRIANQFSQQDK